jgi:hypothetical protein
MMNSEASQKIEATAPKLERTLLIFFALSSAGLFYLTTLGNPVFDELIAYYTDRVATVAEMVRIQATMPVSLDPPAYHLFSHWLLQTRFDPMTAMRLPSLLGGLLMAFSVYLFTRRLMGVYAAAMAATGLLLLNALRIVEARPYGILLGATGLALLLWQNCIRGNRRKASLTGLFLVLGLAVSSHYFGILVALPLLIAEGWRSLARRRIDFPVLAALLGSYGFVLGWLPFLKPAAAYRSHYYSQLSVLRVLDSYAGHKECPVNGSCAVVHVVIALLVLVVVLAGGVWLARRFRNQCAEWVAVVSLALLPIMGGLLAVFTSGAFEARHMIEYYIGLLIVAAGLVAAVTKSRWQKRAYLALLLILLAGRIVQLGFAANKEHKQMQQYLALDYTSRPVVLTDAHLYLRLHYLLDPKAANLFWVYDLSHAVEWKHPDTLDRTAENLRMFTALPILSYDEVKSNSFKLMVQRPPERPWPQWLPLQLAKDGAHLEADGAVGDYRIYLAGKP